MQQACDLNLAALVENAELKDDILDVLQRVCHHRLGHLQYGAIERLPRNSASGIIPTDRTRDNCSTCAQGKQSNNRQLTQSTGTNYPIDRIVGVICWDAKGPMTPRDRMVNRYMINFIDHMSN